ncbi:unnamed protein product [Rotaria sp. Silwood2]|nr:unnamed protein product [Rotaria sp. Silwood2]
MATITVSTEIICPDCGKRMTKKNWKDHARHKHTMTEDSIQTKYERLQLSFCSSYDKPIPIVMHNFFSTKEFAITVSNSEQQNLNDSVCPSETIIINNQIGILTNSGNESSSKDDTTSGNEKISVFTTAEGDNRNKLDENNTFNNGSRFSQDHQEIIIEDNESSLTSDSNTTDNYEAESNYDQPSVSLQSTASTISNLSDNVIISIKGVRFINAPEMTFVQAHRANYPHIVSSTNNKLPSVKPIPTWFSNEYPWLRAIHTDNQYGFLCVDCAEFASSEMVIKRNNDAFVFSQCFADYELECIKKKDLHRTCVNRRAASRIVSTSGNMIAQLQCVNLDMQTRKYCAVLIQTLWKIIREEMPLAKFKPLIQFLYHLQCPDIVNWFKISNVKERYWSWKAIAEWLSNINKYLHHLQPSSIRKTRYINLIVDETQNISSTTHPCGLVVGPTASYLCCSPDATVAEVVNNIISYGILECNCVYAEPDATWDDLISAREHLCLERKDDKLQLRSDHAYYFQLIALLDILDLT